MLAEMHLYVQGRTPGTDLLSCGGPVSEYKGLINLECESRAFTAKLHYVHVNPVKDGLVTDARDYPFCSYGWFMGKANSQFRQRVFNQPCAEAMASALQKSATMCRSMASALQNS